MSISWETNCMLARVRVNALRALVSAGGEPRAEQLVRAVEPVLGDLLPLPSSAAAAAAAREKAADAAGRWAAIDVLLSAVGTSRAVARPAATVVTETALGR